MVARLSIQQVTEETESLWQAFVADHPHSTAFHTLAWATAVHSAFDYPRRYQLLRDRFTNELAAAIPLFQTPELSGRSLTNPFCEYGFPLIAQGEDAGKVLETVAEMAGVGRAVMLKDANWSSVFRYNEAGYGGVQTGITRVLAVDRPHSTLWDREYDTAARRGVRRANEHGLDLVTGALPEFYPLYLDTMRRLGSPPFPKAFFRELTEQFGDALTLLMAQKDGKSIAGLLVIEWNGRAVIWSNVSDEEAWTAHPNHFLYDKAIERGCQRSTSVIDLGRTRVGSGTDQFKAQFGGRTYDLTSFVTPPHRTAWADVAGYERLEPLTQRLAPIITHGALGPRLKRFIHE